MEDLISIIDAAQKKIVDQCVADGDPSAASENRIYSSVVNSGLCLRYDGVSYEEPFEIFLDLLAEQAIARKVISIEIAGPDEGANGTRNWDFTRLCGTNTSFPALKSFTVEPSPPNYHNQTIIAADYDEDGQTANLLARMPAIELLAIPSAPQLRFCQTGSETLQELRVASGYNNENLIQNLVDFPRFPNLRLLDFAEVEPYIVDEGLCQYIAFDDYATLVSSPAYPRLSFVLRNPALTDDEAGKLRRIRRCQIRLVRTRADYVR